MYPLVSVITPCYNMEGYIHMLLDSILVQTYPTIEMFVIDDGSTDRSVEIVKRYTEKFNQKGYSLHCILQNRGGQSVAIKRGLTLIQGKYLVWPDADDYYNNENAISEMVETLERASHDVKMVRTQERLVEDYTLKEVKINGTNAKELEQESLFEDCLYGNNDFYYCSGAYMVDVNALFELTGFEIYTDKYAGQNWQIMLPILYSYRCMTILKPYYTVVCRNNSHSRGQYTGYEETHRKYMAYYKTLINTLDIIKKIPQSDKKRYVSQLKSKYNKLFFKTAVKYGKNEMVCHYYGILKADDCVKATERFFYVLSRMRILHPLSWMFRIVNQTV